MNSSNRLYMIFFTITSICVILLFLSWYKSHKFDTNPLSKDIKSKVNNKKNRVLRIIKNEYNLNFNTPLLITDKMNSKLFGMTTYDTQTNVIKIYLNKKRFKESEDYMIEDVIPHEYAHAIMFKFGDFSHKNSGHTLRWQKVCLKLEGKRCDRFVNHEDILVDKTKLF